MSAYRCEECGFDGPLSEPCQCEDSAEFVTIKCRRIAEREADRVMRALVLRIRATRAALAEKPVQNFAAYRWAKWARSELTRVRAERDAALARVAELEKAPAGVAVHIHVTQGAMEFANKTWRETL